MVLHQDDPHMVKGTSARQMDQIEAQKEALHAQQQKNKEMMEHILHQLNTIPSISLPVMVGEEDSNPPPQTVMVAAVPILKKKRSYLFFWAIILNPGYDMLGRTSASSQLHIRCFAFEVLKDALMAVFTLPDFSCKLVAGTDMSDMA